MRYEDAVAALANATNWHKATASEKQNGCVEVNETDVPGWIGVRDTKLGASSPILLFTPEEWRCFALGVKGGEFEV